MKVEIRYPRFTTMFGRHMVFGQLYKDGKMVFDGSLAQILEVVFKNKFELENSQEILDLVVRQHGFAS